jgi:hypothetical protein
MITNTMVHMQKISNFENFHHVNELSSFEQIAGFRCRHLCVQYIRHTRLYASNKAPRCPFHMIFLVQLSVYTTNPVMATMTAVADDDGVGGRRRR